MGTTCSNNLYLDTTWNTNITLNSDHLPIITTLNIKQNFKLNQGRETYTNYRKADWISYTEEIEEEIKKMKTSTDIILTADKHNIPKGKINNNNKLLPKEIRDKMKTRDIMREQDRTDTNIQIINKEINKN